MAIDINHVLSAFQGSLHLNMRILREIYGVQTLDLMPRADSLLGLPPSFGKRSLVRLNCDNAIAPYVIQVHCWQPEEYAFVNRTMQAGRPFTLVDIGANVGLFSRQCLAHIHHCEQVFAYEPDPGNFSVLEFNLTGFDNVVKQQVGLAASQGVMNLYIDPDNSGNYSLNSAAMAGEHSVREIQCLDIRGQAADWMASGRPIFYKSDTQGFDETLFTALDEQFWENVTGGIMEVWRIAKPTFDREKLARVLDQFGNRCFLDKPSELLSTAQVMDYLDGSDGASHDLGFWR